MVLVDWLGWVFCLIQNTRARKLPEVGIQGVFGNAVAMGAHSVPKITLVLEPCICGLSLGLPDNTVINILVHLCNNVTSILTNAEKCIHLIAVYENLSSYPCGYFMLPNLYILIHLLDKSDISLFYFSVINIVKKQEAPNRVICSPG